jgi:hypothetical protein
MAGNLPPAVALADSNSFRALSPSLVAGRFLFALLGMTAEEFS